MQTLEFIMLVLIFVMMGSYVSQLKFERWKTKWNTPACPTYGPNKYLDLLPITDKAFIPSKYAPADYCEGNLVAKYRDIFDFATVWSAGMRIGDLDPLLWSNYSNLT